MKTAQEPNAERILITKIIEASGEDYLDIEEEIQKVTNDPAHKIVLDAMETYAKVLKDELDAKQKRIAELEEEIKLLKNGTN